MRATVESNHAGPLGVVGVEDGEVHYIGRTLGVVVRQDRMIELDPGEVRDEELHRPPSLQLGDRLGGHPLLLPVRVRKDHPPIRPVDESPQPPAEAGSAPDPAVTELKPADV